MDHSFSSTCSTLLQQLTGRHLHRALLLEYYEFTLKYTSAIDAKTLGVVLQNFCSPFGLHHSDPTVRSQCCYHLRTLCKQLSSTMKIHSTFVVGLLQALHPMLLVPLRVDDSTATTSLSRRSRSSSGRSDDLKFADRLQVCSWFLFVFFFEC